MKPPSILIALVLCSLAAKGQGSLEQLVENFAGSRVLSNAVVAIDVRDGSDGTRLASHNAGTACIPASTQKLITTAVALDLLGEDYRFRTRLIAGGPIEAGTLRGNLYIEGGGDPTLGSTFFDEAEDLNRVVQAWVAAVVRAGVTKISGAVVGDGSRYGTAGTGAGWPWADLGNYYGAGAYGLNINENSYTLSFTQRTREGSTPPVSGTEPDIPGLVFHNELISGPRGSGDQAYIYGAPFNFQQFIRGSIPVGTGRFRIRGSIPDPPLLAAQLLTTKLRAAGIEVVRPPATDRTVGAGNYANARVLDEVLSPPLSEIVDRTNLRSVNLYAEALLRELNRSVGSPIHEMGSTEVLTDWLTDRGLDVKGIRLRDGSGLDPRNFITPALMTDFLVDRSGESRWLESIPVAGRTGSLKSTLRGTVAEGRVRAKSGTVNAARAYAGYVDRPDGVRLAFSVAVNNYTMSTRQLSTLLYGFMRDLCTVEL